MPFPWSADSQSWDSDPTNWNTEYLPQGAQTIALGSTAGGQLIYSVSTSYSIGLKQVGAVQATFQGSRTETLALSQGGSVVRTYQAGQNFGLTFGDAGVVNRTSSLNGSSGLALGLVGGAGFMSFVSATCGVQIGMAPGVQGQFGLQGAVPLALSFSGRGSQNANVDAGFRVGWADLGAVQYSAQVSIPAVLALGFGGNRRFPWDTDLTRKINQWSNANEDASGGWYEGGSGPPQDGWKPSGGTNS